MNNTKRFDRNFNNFNRDFKILSIIFKIVFPLVFLLVFAMIGFQVWLGFKTYQAIDQHGMKSVIERVWEGPNGTIR